MLASSRHAFFLSAVAAQRLGCCCIVCCRSTVWLLLHCRPRHSTVVAADDAVGAVVWAGAAFKSPDASSAVRIAAVSYDIMPKRRRCLLCGEHHEESSSCACPRCHEFHAGGDASCLCCALSGCWHAHDACQNVYVPKCCKMCGDPHDPHRPCPCPYCHYWHAGLESANVKAIRYVHALTLIIE